jgi:membrane protein YdbS with pleckstrin-like domain
MARSFGPNPRYLSKLRLIHTLIALGILASGALLGWLLSLDEEIGPQGFTTTLIVSGILALLWWVPAMLLVGPYYQSLHYEVRDDEVVVRVGIVTKAVKHVPFRTVTNLTVNRGILDRWLYGLGTLNVQTAGMSGTTGAEESLVGLSNTDEVYEMVAAELRRFRGAMAPTAAGDEGEPAALPASTMSAILDEVRAIRQALEKENGR